MFEETWLGADGQAYVSEASWVQHNTEPFCSVLDVRRSDRELIDAVISRLQHLLSLAAPELATNRPARVDCLGTSFEIIERQRGSNWLPIQSDVAVDDAQLGTLPGMSVATAGDIRSHRTLQIRFLFLAWLEYLRRRGVSPKRYDGMVANPENFLRGFVTDGSPARFILQLPDPPDFAPMVLGGSVTLDEVRLQVHEALAAGQAAWVRTDVTYVGMLRKPSTWMLLPTEAGAKFSEALREPIENEDRAWRIRRLLLKWVGEHAVSPHRTQPLYTHAFLAADISIVDNIPCNVIELQGAISWLRGARFLSAASAGLLVGEVVSLTELGYICLQEYDGNLLEAPLFPKHGPDQRVSVTAEYVGNVAAHSTVERQVAENIGGEPLDIEALRKFAQATVRALPGLGLSEQQQRAASALADDIASTASQPNPDPRKLRALGRTLRTIVEGAAAGALTSGVLSLWNG
ncbi:hypothetical protein JNW88_30030 [Micromonospora sp. ATA32]|nr:hypothetical protein [Micromonospora sp. ATA32]